MERPKKLSDLRPYYEANLADTKQQLRKAVHDMVVAVEAGDTKKAEQLRYKSDLLHDLRIRHEGTLDALDWIDILAPELLKEAQHD